MPRRTDDLFSRCVDLAYATAVDGALWPDLLRTLSESVDCHAGGMVTSTADRSLYEGVSFGSSREAHQNYLRRFHKHHPMRVGRRLEAGRVREWRHILPRPMLERTEVYEVWNRPHDMGEGVLLTLWANEFGQQTVTCVRNWQRGPFSSEELGWFRALMPHLCRSAEVSRRLRAVSRRSAAAWAGLYAVPHAMLLLDRAGGVVFANAAAETMLRAEDGLTISRGILSSPHGGASRRLWSLIAAAAPPGGEAGTARLPRPSGLPALAVIAMPLRGSALDLMLMPEEPAVLICVSDPASRTHPPSVLLARLFGLTGAEAELAAGLLASKDLRTIAEESGRSVNTVRNHLTSRQSELIGLLSGLPCTGHTDPPPAS